MIKTLSYLAVAVGAFALGRMSKGRRQSLTFPPEPVEAPQPSIALPSSETRRRPMTAQRLFVLIFLVGWLIAWSFGCLMALKMVLSGNGGLFIIGWLIAALAAWAMAAHTIYKLVTGQEIDGRGGRKF